MKCPACQGLRHKHDPWMSFENGSEEVFVCLDCGRSFEETEAARGEMWDDDDDET